MPLKGQSVLILIIKFSQAPDYGFPLELTALIGGYDVTWSNIIEIIGVEI